MPAGSLISGLEAPGCEVFVGTEVSVQSYAGSQALVVDASGDTWVLGARAAGVALLVGCCVLGGQTSGTEPSVDISVCGIQNPGGSCSL